MRTLKIIVIALAAAFPLWLAAPAAQAAGASLYLTPSSGTKAVGSKFTVTVKVNSGGEVINAAQGDISFDAKKLEVTALGRGGSVFSLWTTEPAYNNSAGTISFGGGIPRPGYTGSAGAVFAITFKAKQAGTADVRFSSGAVLANDGKGTNILASMGSASFNLAASVEPPRSDDKDDQPEAKPEPPYNLPVISSPTHPDQNIWYQANQVKFAWQLPAGVTDTSFSLDQSPKAEPDNTGEGLLSEKELAVLSSGQWYFHLKYKDAKRWGATAHYGVKIDSDPPRGLEIKVEGGDAGTWPVLNMKAEDAESGLANYEVIIGSLETEGHVVPIELAKLEITGLETGEHTAMIKAIDKAGNESVLIQKFNIEPIAAPEIKDFPAEVDSGDLFYAGGTSLPGARIHLRIEDERGRQVASTTAVADSSGNWFLLWPETLPDGRYTVSAMAENTIGIKSTPSRQVSFLVTPPIFARLGSWVINYFTVFASLIFLILLIVVLFFYLWGLMKRARRRLRKETIEVEEVLEKNLTILKSDISQELETLAKQRTPAGFNKERPEAEARIGRQVDSARAKIMKEIKDVEILLK